MLKKDKLDLDIMCFKPDKLSGFMVMLFAAINVVLTLLSVAKMEYTMRVFIFSMYNIVLTLVVLMASSMVKMYKPGWSISLIAIGAIQLARLAIIPNNTNTALNISLYVISGLILVLTGLYSLYVSMLRKNYLAEREAR